MGLQQKKQKILDMLQLREKDLHDDPGLWGYTPGIFDTAWFLQKWWVYKVHFCIKGTLEGLTIVVFFNCMEEHVICSKCNSVTCVVQWHFSPVSHVYFPLRIEAPATTPMLTVGCSIISQFELVNPPLLIGDAIIGQMQYIHVYPHCVVVSIPVSTRFNQVI